MGAFRDLSGTKINGIEILKPSGRRGSGGQYYYYCKCHCGNVFETTGASVLTGHTKSCGCSRWMPRPNRFGPQGHADLIGKEVGDLTVVEYKGYDSVKKRHLWLCQCKCGRTKICNSRDLQREHCKSCGECNYVSRKAKERKVFITDDEQRLRQVFNSMKSRIFNPNNPEYYRYGGRGLTICDEWLKGGSRVFADWALEHGYKKGLTLERLDNNKGYSPDNCSWKDRFAQMNNTSANHWIQLSDDVRLSRAQCARLADISYDAARKMSDERLAERTKIAIQNCAPRKVEPSDIEFIRNQISVLPIQSLSPTAEILRRIFG